MHAWNQKRIRGGSKDKGNIWLVSWE